MGDPVSKAEWAKRRKNLDKDIAKNESDMKSSLFTGNGKQIDADYVRKTAEAKKSNDSYKKTYGKELGYEKNSKKVSAQGDKPVTRKQADTKKTTKKIVTTKR